jgi:hypothetical protein
MVRSLVAFPISELDQVLVSIGRRNVKLMENNVEFRVRRGTVRVRRGSVGCGEVQKGVGWHRQ